MKKKVLSLFLIVSLMFAFTAISFANNGANERLDLDPGESDNTYLYAKDMESADDTLYVMYKLDEPDAEILVSVYDRTTSERIASEYFQGDSVYHEFKDVVIDPTHDYIIVTKNFGEWTFQGNLLVVVN